MTKQSCISRMGLPRSPVKGGELAMTMEKDLKHLHQTRDDESLPFFNLSDLPTRKGLMLRIDGEVNDRKASKPLFQIVAFDGLKQGFVI